MQLDKACEEFIRKKRNFSVAGHQRKYMFDVKCPFVDAEGLRFILTTNNPYDYLNYKPTLDHVFLDEPSIRGFERYVDLMFGSYDGDMCYFKILRTLLPDHFANLNSIVKRGKYLQRSPPELYKVPICLLPVMEFHALEDYSSVYNVKSSCVSLERMHIRLKLNSFFIAVIELLNCTENDHVEVLYNKGVLPSMDFQLISTQKELTIGLKLTRSCGGLMDDMGNALRKHERQIGLVEPRFCEPNTNLCQALQCLFVFHPLYRSRPNSLFVDTEVIDGGKGRLARAVPNKKGTSIESPKNQAKLPKKLLNESTNWDEVMEQIKEAVTAEFLEELSERRSVETQTEPTYPVAQEPQEDDLLSTALRLCVPEIHVPPGFDSVFIDQSMFSSGGVVLFLPDGCQVAKVVV